MGICKSCGKPLEDGAKFCPSCGAVATSGEQVAKQENIGESRREGQTEKKKKSFFKTPLFIGLVALLLGGGVLAAALVMNKSPKEAYLYAEYKTYEKTMEETEERYGETFEFQNKMLKEPSTSKLAISGDMEMASAAGDPAYDIARELMQALEISMEISQNPEKKENFMKLGLNLEGESAIDAEIFQSEDQMGISVPVLYDTFFYINSDEYGEFMRMFDPTYMGPEEYSMNNLDFEDIKLSEKEKEYLKETYVEFIYENLDEKYFSEKKNVGFEHEGVKLELRELTLKMSPKESKEFLTNFVDQLIKDEKLQDMAVKRAEVVYEQVAFAEEDAPAFDEKQIKKELVDGLKEIKKDVKDLDIKKGLTSKILVDKDNYIIERDMTMEIGDTSLAFNSKDVPDGDKKRYQDASIKLAEIGDSGENIVFNASNDISYKEGGRTEDMKIGFVMEGIDEGEMSFSMKSDYDGESAKKQEVDRTFSLNISDPSSDETVVKGSVKQSNDVNAKENYSKDTYTIEVEIEDQYDPIKFTLNIDSDSQIKDSVKMPDLADGASGATNAVDLTEEDMLGIYEEVVLNLMTVAEALGINPYDFMGGGYYDDAYYDDYYYEEEAYEETFEDYYDDSEADLEEEATDL